MCTSTPCECKVEKKSDFRDRPSLNAYLWQSFLCLFSKALVAGKYVVNNSITLQIWLNKFLPHLSIKNFVHFSNHYTMCVEISFNQVVEFLPWGLHFLSQVCASKPKTDFLPFKVQRRIHRGNRCDRGCT